jgi:hypothetical protein
MTFFATASGLMIERVRSTAIYVLRVKVNVDKPKAGKSQLNQ